MESLLTKPASKIQSFTDLYVWQEGHKLVSLIYTLTGKLPRSEERGLISQLQRAVVSVTSNIAEGFRKRSAKEKRQFYTTALASLTEIQNQILIARDIHHIENSLFLETADQSVKTAKLINGLIRGAPSYK